MEGLPLAKRGSLKSLTSLWSCMADDLAMRCCTSATRDKTYVASRVEHEGLSFFAITLADFGKAFEKTLDLGLVASWDGSSSFRMDHLTGLPHF